MTAFFDEDIDEVDIHESPKYKAAIYDSAIKELAITRSGNTLLNSGPEHAAVVLENILLQSKEVHILAGNFNEQVCNDNNKRFEKALRNFLLNKGKISVLLNEYNPSEALRNRTLNILKEYSAEENYNNYNIQVKTTSVKPIIGGNEVHYTIGDESMYRLEFDTKNFFAQFCFNDVETSKKLNENFHRYFDSASILNLRLP